MATGPLRPGLRVPARALLLVVAVGAIAWLAIGLHAARLQARAETFQPGDSVSERTDMLERAARLTPSTEPEVREAQILLEARRPGEAARVLREVARREPENREAWAGLVQILGARAEEARRRLAELVPPVSERP
jgi:cytochrome c-type biogenesis protein CcmH/NrfG